MNRRKCRKHLLQKSVAVMLALMVGVTFIPLLGNGVCAAQQDAAKAGQAVDSESAPGQPVDAVTEGAQSVMDAQEPVVDEPGAGTDVTVLDITGGEDSVADDGAPDVAGTAPDDKGAAVSEPAEVGSGNLEAFFNELRQLPAPADDSQDLSVQSESSDPEDGVSGAKGASKSREYFKLTRAKQWSNKFRVRAKVVNDYIGYVVVDNEIVINYVENAETLADLPRSIDRSLSLKNFDVGYHTVSLYTYKSITEDNAARFTKKKIARRLLDKPDYKGVFEVYSKYLVLNPYTFGSNQSHDLYLQYKIKGNKKWQRSGAMESNLIQVPTEIAFKLSGLKANKKYKTRLRYGEYVTYSESIGGTGKSYLFLGPALSTGIKKTGKAKKPKIKSVKVKATHIKFHKHRVPGHYEWVGNSLIWFKGYTEKYYTCKVKVTIKLKKKPGAKGICVQVNNGYNNVKYLKGNKKTYTTTFNVYPNYFTKRPPKSMNKCKVKIWSYQSKTYGGYSPKAKRTKKVR